MKDTSGRGLDGLLQYLRGSVQPIYDATEKALVFDGTNDYVFKTTFTSRRVWVVRIVHPCGSETVHHLAHTQLLIGTYASNQRPHFILDTHSFRS